MCAWAVRLIQAVGWCAQAFIRAQLALELCVHACRPTNSHKLSYTCACMLACHSHGCPSATGLPKHSPVTGLWRLYLWKKEARARDGGTKQLISSLLLFGSSLLCTLAAWVECQLGACNAFIEVLFWNKIGWLFCACMSDTGFLQLLKDNANPL